MRKIENKIFLMKPGGVKALAGKRCPEEKKISSITTLRKILVDDYPLTSVCSKERLEAMREVAPDFGVNINVLTGCVNLREGEFYVEITNPSSEPVNYGSFFGRVNDVLQNQG